MYYSISAFMGFSHSSENECMIYCRNWAVELTGGNTGSDMDNNSTCSEFDLNITLTDSGLQNYHSVRICVCLSVTACTILCCLFILLLSKHLIV